MEIPTDLLPSDREPATTAAKRIRVKWRAVAGGGWQLSCSLWWVVYAGPSEAKPGQYYWKSYNGVEAYTPSLQEAKDAAQRHVMSGRVGDGSEYYMEDQPAIATDKPAPCGGSRCYKTDLG